MPWANDHPARQRSDAAYASPEYKRNREAARRRAGGRCEECHHPHGRLQCDHITPLSQGGTHGMDNLRMVCAGPGSCRCHERKTAQEGRGYRGSKTMADPDCQPRTKW